MYSNQRCLFFRCSTVIFFSIVFFNSAYSQECQLDLQDDIPFDNQPVFVDSNSNLIIPELTVKKNHGALSLQKNQEVILLCPGKGNSLEEFEESKVTGKCGNNGNVNADGDVLSEDNLVCRKNPDSYIKATKTKCGGSENALIFNIGFQVEGDTLATLFSLCHNVKETRTLYTRHQVFPSIQGAQSQSKRPNFRVGDKSMFKGLPPNKAYNLAQQVRVFENILGSKAEAQKYINSKMFMSRGHLAPDGDFLMAAWQWATYYYANVSPQFQSINAGNWLKVERAVRQLAENIGTTLDITTGTHGILTLANTPVYLDPRNKGIPVPTEFFKIIYEPQSSLAIALVCSNDPFLENPPELLCKTDICASNNWSELQDDYKKGFCYCCDPREMSTNVSFVPVPDIKGILKFQ